MKKWLLNPFVYIAGAKALVIGWAIMMVTAVISYYSHSHFDGVIDMHVGRVSSLQVYFLEQLIDWGCIVLVLYLTSLIFSTSRIRFIDVAGTMALARWPMIICAGAAFGIKNPQGMHTIDDVMKHEDTLIGIAIYGMFLVLPLIIWMVVLIYNAFKVSCNIKGTKGTWVFIASLVMAEVLAHLLLIPVYKHLI